jgi:hypothetical protein
MAAVALDKKRLWRDIAREERKKARAKLAELRVQLRAARAERAAAIVAAVERCRTERLAARERARALRIRGLAELREATRLERANARDACSANKGAAKSLDAVRRRRAELGAEAAYQAELRAIERASRARAKEHPHATYIERRGESDDEVRANVSPDLLALWEKVKKGIKGSPRMTRTEEFLRYVENNPGEQLLALESKTDALIRELEQRERDVRKAMAQPRRSREPSRASVADVPF